MISFSCIRSVANSTVAAADLWLLGDIYAALFKLIYDMYSKIS